jgi:hypothetical protein
LPYATGYAAQKDAASIPHPGFCLTIKLFKSSIFMIRKLHFFQLLIITCMVTASLTACNKTGKGSSDAKIPFTGVYGWKFEIPTMGKQLSVHRFYADSIRYEMTGTAYNNSYKQELVWYNTEEQRCVTVGRGGGKDGVYFVMFFKDITANTLAIYKKQCTTKEEAMTISIPAAGTEADHGWNVYHKQ